MKLQRRKTWKKISFFKCTKTYYDLLRISWSVQVKEYFKTSTLHGVKYLAETNRPIYERLLWFFCILTSMIATVVIIVNLWDKFQTNPTITGLDTDFQNFDVPFPTVTVCLNYKIWREILENTNSSSQKNEDFKYLKVFSYESLKDVTNEELEEMRNEKISLKMLKSTVLYPSCEKVFLEDSCDYLSFKKNCCKHFVPLLTELGFCYSFNLRSKKWRKPSMIKDTDPSWSLKFSVIKPSTDANMAIYLHDFYEIPTIDFSPQHDWDYVVEQLSFSLKQTYTTNNTRQLSIKQRQCIFDDEVKLDIIDVYTFSGCTRQCRMRNSMRKCKCILPIYPETEKYRICNSEEVKCIVDNLKYITDVEKCDCQLRCFDSVYEVEKMKLGEDNNASGNMETNFVSWPMVKYKREVLFGWVDLLVSFGGIAGFFLGCSLLSGIEIIYFFTIRAVCMIFSERKLLEDIRDRKKLQPVPDYDLSLIPYFIKKPISGSGMQEIVNRFYPELSNKQAFKTIFIQVKPAPIKKPMKYIKPPFGIDYCN